MKTKKLLSLLLSGSMLCPNVGAKAYAKLCEGNYSERLITEFCEEVKNKDKCKSEWMSLVNNDVMKEVGGADFLNDLTSDYKKYVDQEYVKRVIWNTLVLNPSLVDLADCDMVNCEGKNRMQAAHSILMKLYLWKLIETTCQLIEEHNANKNVDL